MSKERELLIRVIDGCCSYNARESLAKEIEEFLAQPEQDLEDLKKDWVNFGYTTGKLEAPPKRMPLSYEDLQGLYQWVSFTELARIIEKAHGIGVGHE